MGSIYDSIGGAPAVAAAVDDFYVWVLGDAELVPYFANVNIDRLKGHQRSFIASAIGGPAIFKGRSMKQAHAGLGVTPDHFDRVVVHLVESLDSLGVPAETIGTIAEALAPLKAEIAVPVAG